MYDTPSVSAAIAIDQFSENNLGAEGVLADVLELGEERRGDLLAGELDVFAPIVERVNNPLSLSLSELEGDSVKEKLKDRSEEIRG